MSDCTHAWRIASPEPGKRLLEGKCQRPECRATRMFPATPRERPPHTTPEQRQRNARKGQAR